MAICILDVNPRIPRADYKIRDINSRRALLALLLAAGRARARSKSYVSRAPIDKIRSMDYACVNAARAFLETRREKKAHRWTVKSASSGCTHEFRCTISRARVCTMIFFLFIGTFVRYIFPLGKEHVSLRFRDIYFELRTRAPRFYPTTSSASRSPLVRVPRGSSIIHHCEGRSETFPKSDKTISALTRIARLALVERLTWEARRSS